MFYQSDIVQKRVPVFVQNTERLKKAIFKPFFRYMRGTAFFFVLELSVTLPDDLPVWIVGVPDLGAVCCSAVAADYPAGKGAVTVMPFSTCFPLPHDTLNFIPCARLYDCRVAVFHIVLRNFAFIDFLLLCEEVSSKFLFAIVNLLLIVWLIA